MKSVFERLRIKRILAAPKIVKLLLAQQFFEGFVPIMALYAIMFERVGGLSFEKIGFLFAIWSLAYLVAELPSGVLADYWSRKNVIILGGLLRAAGFAVWMVWPTFTGYAIGFALWGAMIACTSGAVAAYLYNELKVAGQDKQYAKYFGWVMSSYWLGALLGFVVASIFTLQHTGWLIGLSIVASLLFAAVLVFAPEHFYKKQATYLKTLRAGFREILHSKKLRYVCYGLFATFMIIGVLEELLPRLYANFGLSDTAISLTLALALIATVVLLTKLESFVRFSLAKQLLCMALGIGLLLVGLYKGGIQGSALILIFSLIFHLFRTLFQHHVQAVAVGDERATIGSVPGLASGLLGAGAYALIGKGAELSSERFSIGVYGAVWLMIVLVLAFMGRKYGNTSPKNPQLSGVLASGQPPTQL